MKHSLKVSMAAAAGLALWLGGPADGRASATSSAEYVGSEMCAVCHDQHAVNFTKNVHANVRTSWGMTGCESCHGPGSAHIENPTDLSLIRGFSKAKGARASEACLSCHERGLHAQWQGSAHDGRGVGCVTCHSVHAPKSPKAMLAAKSEFDLCTKCHLQKKGALMRSSHMPMREGSMTCSSCHNPHGGAGPSSLKQASVNDNCYSCHAEKRAPMLWEHPPVKENCLSCHDPHGSLHRNLLVAKVPHLCQQCHDEVRHPTTPAGSAQAGAFFPNTRIFNKGCVNCHSQVHGSNHPSGVRLTR